MSRFAAIENVALERQLTPLGLAVLRVLKRIGSMLGMLTGKIRRNPDDGFQAAGVIARLKPPPPVLSANVANPLPESEGETA